MTYRHPYVKYDDTHFFFFFYIEKSEIYIPIENMIL